MTAASNRDRATGLAWRPECACRWGDGIRIFVALMKVAARAHRWSRVLLLYVGLLVASVNGKSPSQPATSSHERVRNAAGRLIPTSTPPHPPPPPPPTHHLHHLLLLCVRPRGLNANQAASHHRAEEVQRCFTSDCLQLTERGDVLGCFLVTADPCLCLVPLHHHHIHHLHTLTVFFHLTGSCCWILKACAGFLFLCLG